MTEANSNGKVGTKTEDEWYELNSERLQAEFIENAPEDFPTSESMQEIENNNSFNDWCEEQFKAEFK